MAIKYLKKSPKTPSTDDSKTNEIVKGLLKEIEISKEMEKASLLLAMLISRENHLGETIKMLQN